MFGELVKPIDTLINRSCDGIGGFLKPWQMVRIAKAEIVVEQLKAQVNLEGSGALIDAQKLLIHDAIDRQANLHNIKVEAANNIENEESFDSVSEEFINSFVKEAQDVSDEVLQQLWGKILAGELQNKGSFSKRTLKFISTLSVVEANNIYSLFNGLAFFNGSPELFLTKPSIFSYNTSELPSQAECDHLEALGIFTTSKPLKIQIHNSDKGNQKTVNLKNIVITLDKKVAFDIEYTFYATDKDSKSLIITKTPLTLLGRELAQIARPKPNRKLVKQIASSLGENNMFITLHPRRYRP